MQKIISAHSLDCKIKLKTIKTIFISCLLCCGFVFIRGTVFTEMRTVSCFFCVCVIAASLLTHILLGAVCVCMCVKPLIY